MEALQIVILIIGALLFTVSFFIPDKQVNPKEIRDKEERIFKELVEKEIPNVRRMIEEAAEDSIERAKENTQRQMERLTNEKMMAINEYSDTVMSEIHKNHEEAVFLYDMLNNKHAQVKNTAAELNQVMKQSKQAQAAVKSAKTKEEKKASKTSADERATAAVELVESAIAAKQTEKPETVEENQDAAIAFEPMAAKELEVIIPPEEMEKPSKSKKEKKKDTTEADAASAKNVEIMFATEGNEENSNDRILELHKAGKSNMAIARELGLGIGEVKLVIDLFKGGM